MANTPFKLKGWSGFQSSPMTKPTDDDNDNGDDAMTVAKKGAAARTKDIEAQQEIGTPTKDEVVQARIDYGKYTKLRDQAEWDEVNYTTADYVNFRNKANAAAKIVRAFRASQ